MKTTIPAEDHRSIADMFLNITEVFKDKIAFLQKIRGNWEELKFKEVRTRVENISLGLRSLGIEKTDHVAILSENRLEWALCDYAIICTGAVTVTIYPTLLSEQVEYLLRDSESKVIFVQNREQFSKVQSCQKRLKSLKQIIVMDNSLEDGKITLSLRSLEAKGKAFKSEPSFEERARSLTREDLLTIIYTSGTTGAPKGVMLSHGNIMSNVEAGLRALKVTSDDILLSFLPLSHSFERTVGHFGPFAAGACIAYAESLDTIPQNIGEIRPTVMTGVPRFYEKLYAGIIQQVSESPKIRRKIFYFALKTGKQCYNLKRDKKPVPLFLRLKHKLANLLVFKKIHKKLGGRLHFFISGGAPLSLEIAEFFHSMGILILEAYGLTETSPGISINLENNFKAGTAGLPLDNVEVKIAEDGEILTRGPHVMRGYWKREKDTGESIDKEGWFHTGDIGYIDEDGFLIITDRKKDILVTSGGKNIAPAPIENQLKKIPLIEQVVVIGDRRKFISALIVPNKNLLLQKASQLSIHQDYSEILKNKTIIGIFQEMIEDALTNFARFEKVKKFRLIEEPFTIENKLLTPKMSIKRKLVLEKYKTLIDEMYTEQV